jgi:hypothetical protein
MTYDINLNLKQPVTEDNGRDKGIFSNYIQNCTICKNTTSMRMERIYADDLKYSLNSNDDFKLSLFLSSLIEYFNTCW